VKKNRLRLKKTRLAAAVMLSTLLLVSIPFGVCQTSTPESVVINELMANNDTAVPGPYGDYPDWIELYNGGAESVDVGGMYLTGNLANPDAWQFPSGTIIESNGFLIVWADNSPDLGALHTSFSLNASGEAIGLFATDGVTRIDSITFGPQDDDVSFGRLPDGGLSWNQLTPTPGSPNQLYEPAEIPDDLFINEFMANNNGAVTGHNGTYPDWIELYNASNETIDLSDMYLTDDLTKPEWQFPAGTTIEPNGFLIVWADNSPDQSSLHASFGLNTGGESIGLFASDGESIIDSVTFDRQVSDVSYGRLPDGSENWNYLTPTPGSSNDLGEVVNVGATSEFGSVPEGLFINELMADNQITVTGPDGTYPDWIELYNASNKTIDLGGMFLTDTLANPTKWRFPNDTLIEPEGYLLIWADNSSDKNSLHAGFNLRANGEEVGLFANDGVTLIDSVVFPKQLGDVSYGRFPDGSENWEPMLRATPGWGNNKPQPTLEFSPWTVLLLIGIIAALSALVIVAGKIHAKRKK